jgi:ankyrin repeat protein
VEEGKANVNAVVPSDGGTPVLRMLKDCNKDAIKKLLEYHPDLTIKQSNGLGPLHLALTPYSADITIVQALLDAGADPDGCNRAGDTPLLAMRMDSPGAIDIVNLLLRLGADINAKDRLGHTVLSRTVRRRSYGGRSNHADIQQLLDRGADLHTRDQKGKSLLHHAVATHDLIGFGLSQDQGTTRLDYLLGLGLDVQGLDRRGNTIVHELAMRSKMLDSYNAPGLIRLWEHLLDLGVDIDQRNHQGRTALQILSASREDRYGSSSPTFRVGYFGPLDFVISRVKDVNQPDNEALTALHLASTVSEYVAKKLLDAGADPSRSTIEGLTSLHLATRARQSNIVGMLVSSEIAKSYIVNVKDEKGNTPLYYACRSGRPETVQLLFDAGADASNKDLWLACAEFEDEEKLWAQDRHPADVEANGEAGGLTINDTSRPGPLPDKHQQRTNGIHSWKDTTRIGEILEMLVMHGCDSTGLISGQGQFSSYGVISNAAHSRHDYTFECLTRVRNGLPNVKHSTTTSYIQYREHAIALQQDAIKKAAIESALRNRDQSNLWLVEDVLKTRQYHVMRPLFDNGVNFLTEKQPAFELFVQHG